MCACVYVFTPPRDRLAVKTNLLCAKRLKQITREVFSSHISDSTIRNKNTNKKCIQYEMFMQNRGSEFISIFAVLRCTAVNCVFKNSSEIQKKKGTEKKRLST